MNKFQDHTNGFTNGHSVTNSPEERPQSRQSTVEITLSGRSRSRQDLCPDRPRSRFEHAVWRDGRSRTQCQETRVNGKRSQSSNRVTDEIMALGHIDTIDRILNRSRDKSWLGSDRFVRSSSRASDYKPADNRWLSSERLTEPWTTEEKWWLSRNNDTFLDTDSRVFGRKKIYLVDKKAPKSESDIRNPEIPERKKQKLLGSNPIL